MIALDAGLLAFAVNRGVPEHARAARAVESLANGDRPWALPVSEAHAFLRLVTHPHRVGRPLGLPDALAVIETLLAGPQARLLLPTARHAAVVREVLGFLPAGEPAPLSLETAALLREHDVREVLTCGRELGRYPFLQTRDPVHGAPWTPQEPPARRYRVLKPRAARG